MTSALGTLDVIGRATLTDPPARSTEPLELDLDLRHHPKGQVVDAGEAVLFVPLIGLAAPTVEGLTVTGTLESAEESQHGLEFSIFGLKIGGGYTLTVEKSLEASCAAGKSVRIDVRMPVLWRLMAPPNTTDDGLWVEVEPQHVTSPLDIVVRPLALAEKSVEPSRFVVVDGSPPLTLQQSVTYTRESEYGVGLESAAIPVTAGVTVKRSSTQTLTLAATLPAGHAYVASHYADVAGGVIVLA